MRILFVAMPDSMHTAQWINLVADEGWDLFLFPAYEALLHPSLQNITIYGFSSIRTDGINPSVRIRTIWPFSIGSGILGLLANHIRPSVRSTLLALIIRLIKPDIVHSLEFQHSGYLTMDAKSKIKGDFPTWIATNWGSDIYLFGRLSQHKEKIKSLLSYCDYYSCECNRDVKLARTFGFKGETLPVLPCAGGYDIKLISQFRQPGPTSSRRLILLKGYQGWAGRAFVGLRAIELCANFLKGYRVAIYLAAPDVELAAELVSQSTGIPIDIIPKCPHEEMLRLHGRARVSIGLSISDAISTSFLEAIAMGSFPIQSNTGCANEWIKSGVTGLLVHPEDPEEIAAAIRLAVTDDALVDEAARINAKVVTERLDQSIIKPKAIAMYENVAAQANAKRGTN